MPTDLNSIKHDLTRRMEGAVETLRKDCSGLRTDRTLVNAVVTAIRNSGLGLNPSGDGQIVRVPIPQLTGERRIELAKAANRYAEGARIAVRGVRRDGMEQIKSLEKKSLIGKDEASDWSDEVQKLTDSFVKRVDEVAADKDREIRQV